MKNIHWVKVKGTTAYHIKVDLTYVTICGINLPNDDKMDIRYTIGKSIFCVKCVVLYNNHIN